MNATQILADEHDFILKIAAVADNTARSIMDTGSVTPPTIEALIDFFRNFTDRCHHAKEERHLFKKLREKGLPEKSGPVAVMEDEHARGRQFIRAIETALPAAASGDTAAARKIGLTLHAYADLLRAHIDKENKILFPMADQLLSPAEQAQLVDAFETVEAEELGEGVHEKYHRLGQELIDAAEKKA